MQPSGRSGFGEMSEGSTRSQMQTGAVTGMRMDSNPGDESMGSITSSPSDSNRAMYPFSDSRPGSDTLAQLAAGQALGDTAAGYRANSGVDLTALTPPLTLTGPALAGMSPEPAGGGAQGVQGQLRGDAGHSAAAPPPQGLAPPCHSAGNPHASTVAGGPGSSAAPAGSSQPAAGHSGSHAPGLAEQPVSGKDKKSKKKLFDGLRSGNFAGFGFYNNSKGD